jgi:hypothetical protein
MLRPYFLQHLRNGEFNFQVFWKDLSDVPGLNYTDFQISRVSLKDAVDLVDKSSWDYLNGYNQQVDYVIFIHIMIIWVIKGNRFL